MVSQLARRVFVIDDESQHRPTPRVSYSFDQVSHLLDFSEAAYKLPRMTSQTGQTLRIVEQLNGADGSIVSSTFRADMASSIAFMAP